MKPDRALKVIDLPGVRELEGDLLLHRDDPDKCAEIVDKLARKLFGIGLVETLFIVPEEYQGCAEFSPEYAQLCRLCEEHEAKFKTSDDQSDDEVMKVLAECRIDFSDDRGLPLRCTKLMSRVVEASAKGIAGKLPDPTEMVLAKFEAKLERDRDSYLANKHRGRR